jgi:hypothetical protein
MEVLFYCFVFRSLTGEHDRCLIAPPYFRKKTFLYLNTEPNRYGEDAAPVFTRSHIGGAGAILEMEIEEGRAPNIEDPGARL